MKEIENLSIGGYAFAVERDAAMQLRDYLGSLEEWYLSREDGQEIMDGIEGRLSELLAERLSGHDSVVTLADVHVPFLPLANGYILHGYVPFHLYPHISRMT